MAVGDHVLHHALGHVHGAFDIDVDEPELVLEVGVHERPAQTDADVEGRGIQGTPQLGHEVPEAFDTVVGGGVRPERVGLGAELLDAPGRLMDAVTRAGQRDVVAVPGELLGQFEPDAGGATGDHGKGALIGHCDFLPHRDRHANTEGSRWRGP